MSTRVYICHTYYHAYQAAVKELVRSDRGSGTLSDSSTANTPAADKSDSVPDPLSDSSAAITSTADKSDSVPDPLSDADPTADILLSTMSNDFEDLDARLRESGIFRAVYRFDEKEDATDETVMSYHRDKGNLFANLLQRVKYTKLLGQLQEPYVPVDLSAYDDVYVFCDSDPIGYYLNYKKIPYHAIEDGLNSGKLDDQARNANIGAFGLKKLLAGTGLIFIECGYSRYCIDYEVNDISVNKNPPKNIIECPVEELYARLTKEDHARLVRIFLPDYERIAALIRERGADRRNVLILTEPLCSLDVRERMFRDIAAMHPDETVIFKPHPRDTLDYEKAFPSHLVLRGRFPMEVLDDIREIRFDTLVSVITQVDHVKFADNIVYLGEDFLDRYEAPEIHRKNELL